MSKQQTLFRVGNSEWTIEETEPGIFELRTSDGKQKLTKMTAKKLIALNAVVAELERSVASH